MNGQCHLRLVEPPRPQASRRYETRIVVSASRLPIGRTRGFHLTREGLDELIAVAMRIEGRRQ
jgi:hypothetical protein